MGLFSKLFKKDKNKNKYINSMSKTRDTSLKGLKNLLNSKGKIDDDLYDELEEMFIMADIGVATVCDFIDDLRREVKSRKITDPKMLQEVIVDKMFEIYLKDEVVNANLKVNKDGLSVYLFVGVNGVGKTTSIGKLAKRLKDEGKKVLLAAGDTFRAGAIDQLDVWAKRAFVDIVKKQEGSDPSSVIFDALQKAKKEKYDVLICDTAGRLQNKVNLMSELSKIKRVIEREVPDAPHDTLLVIDATTGQNGMSQAKAFLEATQVSGVVLTKLDGTAKGGIVLAIRNEFGIPIKFVCLGEKIEDMEPFDIEEYIYGLFADFFEE